jgi:hypothetical protein
LVVDPAVLHNFGAIAPDDSRVAYLIIGVTLRISTCIPAGLTARMSAAFCSRTAVTTRWTGPGRSPSLLSRTTGALDNELFVLDTTSGAVAHLSAHDDITVYLQARFAADGRNIVLLTNHDSEFMRAALEHQDPRHHFSHHDDMDVDWIALPRWPLAGAGS